MNKNNIKKHYKEMMKQSKESQEHLLFDLAVLLSETKEKLSTNDVGEVIAKAYDDEILNLITKILEYKGRN